LDEEMRCFLGCVLAQQWWLVAIKVNNHPGRQASAQQPSKVASRTHKILLLVYFSIILKKSALKKVFTCSSFNFENLI
jgi:hypothetical protein